MEAEHAETASDEIGPVPAHARRGRLLGGGKRLQARDEPRAAAQGELALIIRVDDLGHEGVRLARAVVRSGREVDQPAPDRRRLEGHAAPEAPHERLGRGHGPRAAGGSLRAPRDEPELSGVAPLGAGVDQRLR